MYSLQVNMWITVYNTKNFGCETKVKKVKNIELLECKVEKGFSVKLNENFKMLKKKKTERNTKGCGKFPKCKSNCFENNRIKKV